jgi:hypothetical protein
MNLSTRRVVWQDVPVSIDDDESWSGQPFALPIPNVPLRDTSSTSELGAFLAIGEAWADLVSHFLPKTQTPVVLDLGCGCGKLAGFYILIRQYAHRNRSISADNRMVPQGLRAACRRKVSFRAL